MKLLCRIIPDFWNLELMGAFHTPNSALRTFIMGFRIPDTGQSDGALANLVVIAWLTLSI